MAAGKMTVPLNLTAQKVPEFAVSKIEMSDKVLADESGNFLACGRPVSMSYEKLNEVPKILHPICKQYFTIFQKHVHS